MSGQDGDVSCVEQSAGTALATWVPLFLVVASSLLHIRNSRVWERLLWTNFSSFLRLLEMYGVIISKYPRGQRAMVGVGGQE